LLFILEENNESSLMLALRPAEEEIESETDDRRFWSRKPGSGGSMQEYAVHLHVSMRFKDE